MPPPGGDPAEIASSSRIGSGSASGGGRQTILVSASLDPQRLQAYSRWCAQPDAAASATADGGGSSRPLALVALDSRSALPEEYLRRQLLRAQGEGEPGFGANAARAGTAAQTASDTARLPGLSSLQPMTEPAAAANHQRLQLEPTTPEASAAARSCDGAHQPSPPPGSSPATSPDPSNATSTGLSTSVNNTSEGSSIHSSPALADILPPHLAHVYVLCPAEHRTDRARRLVHALGSERALLFVGRTNQAMVTKYKLEARNMEVGCGPSVRRGRGRRKGKQKGRG